MAPSGAALAAPASPRGSGRIDQFEVMMPELGGRTRTVRVYLPPGYADDAPRRYPVLYLQDGQSLFTPGPYGDWLVDDTLDALVEEGRSDGVVVVGVDNGDLRWNEYGPWVNDAMRRWVDPAWAQPREGGEGDAYVRFLADTLKPEVDRRYRTLPEREHTGIGGSSMGGLLALHAGLTRPEVFARVLAMSPAVWFAEGGGAWLSANRLLARIDALGPLPDVRFYLDVGTDERSRESEPTVEDRSGQPLTYARAYVEGATAVADALRAGGVSTSNLRLVIDAGAVHHESAWARRFPEALLWLYR